MVFIKREENIFHFHEWAHEEMPYTITIKGIIATISRAGSSYQLIADRMPKRDKFDIHRPKVADGAEVVKAYRDKEEILEQCETNK